MEPDRGNPALPRRAGFCAGLFAGLMWVAGSVQATGFSETDSLATARRLHVAVTLSSGKVLVAGGYSAGGSDLASSELYDASTSLWSNAGSFDGARFWHAASALASGGALVIGGANNQSTVLASVERYDAAQNQWNPTGSLGLARFSHTASLLPSGKVLVTGGRTSLANGSVTSSVELYDPASGLWTASGSLAVARSEHTATLLASGRVLVVGGFDGSFHVLASAELYDPVTGTWSLAGTLASGRVGHAAWAGTASVASTTTATAANTRSFT